MPRIRKVSPNLLHISDEIAYQLELPSEIPVLIIIARHQSDPYF